MRNTITIRTLTNGLGINQDRQVIGRDTLCQFPAHQAFLHAVAKAMAKAKHVAMRPVVPVVAVSVGELCLSQSFPACRRWRVWSVGGSSCAPSLV